MFFCRKKEKHAKRKNDLLQDETKKANSGCDVIFDSNYSCTSPEIVSITKCAKNRICMILSEIHGAPIAGEPGYDVDLELHYNGSLYCKGYLTIDNKPVCIAQWRVEKLDEKSVELKKLGVASDLQGRGIGSILINSIHDICRTCGYLHIYVQPGGYSCQTDNSAIRDFVRSKIDVRETDEKNREKFYQNNGYETLSGSPEKRWYYFSMLMD